jgi:RNA polymerase II-associated protein 3
LQLQPGNTDAQAELQKLAPPVFRNESPSTQVPHHTLSHSSNSTTLSLLPSSTAGPSSSSSSTTREPYSPSSDQFTRTYKDDIKLKISFLPMTIDIPVNLPRLVLGPNGKVTRSSLASLPPPDSHTKIESFSYPSWERYMVQKK